MYETRQAIDTWTELQKSTSALITKPSKYILKTWRRQVYQARGLSNILLNAWLREVCMNLYSVEVVGCDETAVNSERNDKVIQQLQELLMW